MIYPENYLNIKMKFSCPTLGLKSERFYIFKISPWANLKNNTAVTRWFPSKTKDKSLFDFKIKMVTLPGFEPGIPP